MRAGLVPARLRIDPSMSAEYPVLVTMITMRVRKVLFCSAIHLPTQQPADQKKEDDQEDAQYSHTRPCFGVFLLVIHP